MVNNALQRTVAPIFLGFAMLAAGLACDSFRSPNQPSIEEPDGEEPDGDGESPVDEPDGTPTNQAPVAVLRGPVAATVGEELVFDARDSADPDGLITAFVWHVNDVPLPETSAILTHKFDTAGTFTIWLTVVDDRGATAGDSLQVTVSGVAPQFRLDIVLNPPNAGTFTLDPPGGLYPAGQTVQVTVDPLDGFTFEGLFDGETRISQSETTPVVVNDNLELTARFAADPTDPGPAMYSVMVSASPAEGGTVTLDPPGGLYAPGAVIQLTAAPADGYAFTSFSGSISSTDSVVSLLVDGHKSIQAHFVWVPAIGNPGNLLVTNFLGANVLEFDRRNGAFLGEFVKAAQSGLSFPGGIALGPGGDAYVVDVGVLSNTKVSRFNGATGDPLGPLVVGDGVVGFLSIEFGPGGNLFVPDSTDNSVGEYDPFDGSLIRTFVASGDGGLSSPAGLRFGPNGNLFVVSKNTNGIIEYEGSTGASLGAAVDFSASGMSVPVDLAFDGAGNLFVTLSGDDSVARVDGSTWTVEAFVESGSGGLNSPGGVLFHPDTGNLLVVSQGTDSVLQYDPQSGQFLGVFAEADPATSLFFGAFRPR